MLEDMPKGHEFEIWSPHITLVPWFPCNSENRLDQKLSDVAGKHLPFEVKAGEEEMWGSKEKFPVMIIDDSGGLNRLHLDIFKTLENNGFPIHQKDYLGEKYTPHVTLRNSKAEDFHMPKGTAIKINKFTLIKQYRLKVSGRMIKSAVRDYELR
jgi:2'-5' RNA ligase